MEDEIFETKFVYPSEKIQTIESFYEPLNLKNEHYWSSLKRTHSKKEDKKEHREKLKKNMKDGKELIMLVFKKDVISKTDFLQTYTCEKAYGNISLFSYSTPFSAWKADWKIT